ncbi:MAG: NAD+ synthase [Candidatus Shapirobacteria bacterium]|nr:NAD+ synthase [Candidatus Shapirobacteria bacterium]
MRDLKDVENKIVQGIRSYVGPKNVFIGISGGIDSAVTAFLCVKALGNKRVFGILMPYSRQVDIDDAITVVNQLNIKYFKKDIKPLVDQFKISDNRFVNGNIMSRVRMTIAYAYANHRNGLVIGTTNKSEMAVGYFTKYGDGGCDLEPIANLYKTEIFELAKLLNIPKNIIVKVPSAGLWDSQTDDTELGFTYVDLDNFLQGEKTKPEIESKIKKLIESSEHKRCLPPTILV